MAGRQVPWPCAIQGGRHELGRDLCARMGTPSAVVPVAASGPGGAVGGGGRGHVDDGHADRGAGAQCRLAPDTPHRRADRRLLPGRRHLGHALHRHACLRALHLRRLRPLDHRAVHAAQHAGVLAGADADGAAPAVRPGAGRRRRAHGAGHWLHADVVHGANARPRLSAQALVGGGVLMGLGIGSMHYIGMGAAQTWSLMLYDPWGVLLSVIVAATMAMLSLWVRFRLGNTGRLWPTLVAGIVMGLAISCMHYAGLYALRLKPGIDA